MDVAPELFSTPALDTPQSSMGLSNGRYSPDKFGWHDYTTKNMVCAAALECSRPEMIDQLARYAVPGRDPSTPVRSGNIYEVYDPRTVVDLPGPNQWAGYAGKVFTLVSDDGMSITNITRPGHVFYDGQITRSLSLSNGAWFVTTQGLGNNVIPTFNLLNEWQGPKIFDYLDAQMRANIEAHH